MRMKPTHRGAVNAGLLGFLFLVPSLFLAGAGIKSFQQAAANKAPTTLTYAEFVKLGPHIGWYTITDTVVDVAHSVYFEQNGVPVDVFAPIKPVKGAATGDVYVEISDSRTLSALIDMNSAKRKGGDAAAASYARQHQDAFIQKRALSGLVSFGRRDPMGEWSRLGRDAATITFIEDGWQPNPALAYGGSIGGILFTIVCAVAMIKGLKRN